MSAPFQHFLLRLSIALVWLYQGLWHKVIEFTTHHRDIMQQALGETWGTPAMKALGTFEALLGILVLITFKPKPLALIQTLLLIGMNGAGILFSGGLIPDIGGMLTTNFVFIMAIWINASLHLNRS